MSGGVNRLAFAAKIALAVLSAIVLVTLIQPGARGAESTEPSTTQLTLPTSTGVTQPSEGCSPTSTFANGALTVVGCSGNDSIVISCVLVFTKVNGSDPSTGPAPCPTVKQITVNGDPVGGGDTGADSIDLSGVSPAFFLNLPIGTIAVTVHGGGSSDTSSGSGDSIRGSGFADALFGEAGGDTLYGGAAQDQVAGGCGNDDLHGEDDTAADTLLTGLGSDTAHLGAGDKTAQDSSQSACAATTTTSTDTGTATSTTGGTFTAPDGGSSGAGHPFGSQTVTGTGTTTATGRPRLGRPTLSRHSFRVGSDPTPLGSRPTVLLQQASAASISASRRAHASQEGGGTNVDFDLTEFANVHADVEKKETGLRNGSTCARATNAVRRTVQRQIEKKIPRSVTGAARSKRIKAELRKRQCTLVVAAGSALKNRIKRTGRAGRNRIHFSGRLGTRALRPGTYRFSLQAVSRSGRRSAIRRLSFRIVG